MDNQYLANRYILGKKLGAGGMGEVYEGFDVACNNKKVAIKKTSADDCRQQYRFQREYRFLKAVEHPNLIRAYSYFEIGNDLYMVLEFVAGKSLGEIIYQEQNSLTLLEQLSIANQAARGVEVLNVGGIAHRDIKPENIMVKPDGEVKILDLGIGKNLIEESVGLTSEGCLVGTISYVSPEQIQGTTSNRSDIFSLGVTLHQFFTWSELSPFYGESPYTILDNIKCHEPPSILHCLHLRGAKPSALEEEIYEELWQILQKALAKDPWYRWESAGIMAQAFASLGEKLRNSKEEKKRRPMKTTSEINPRLLKQLQIIRKECEDEDMQQHQLPNLSRTGRTKAKSANKLTRRNRQLEVSQRPNQNFNLGVVIVLVVNMIAIVALWFYKKPPKEIPQAKYEKKASKKAKKNIVAADGSGNFTSVAEAIANVDAGSTLYLKGIHKLPVGLMITKGIILKGEGIENTQIHVANGEYVLAYKSQEKLELHNLSLVWKGIEPKDVLKVFDGKIVIDGCYFKGNKSGRNKNFAGISIKGNVEGKISHCHITTNQIGILVEGKAMLTISQNKCTKSKQAGIAIFNHASNAIISHNTCYQNDFHGIYIGQNVSALIEENVCFDNYQSGIVCTNESKAVIRKNTCYKNKYHGIQISQRSFCKLENNICKQNYQAGIAYFGESGGSAQKNKCYSNGISGIQIRQKSKPQLFANQCYNNGQDGISSHDWSQPQIENNRCYNNKSSGISFFDSSLGIASDNICQGNLLHGIVVRENARPSLLKNSCIKNKQCGIAYFANAAGIAQSNYCQENYLYGIYLEKNTNPRLKANLYNGNLRGKVVRSNK